MTDVFLAGLDKWARTLLPGGGTRDLTDAEKEGVEAVLDAAAQWESGELHWSEAASVAPLSYANHVKHREMNSPQYARFVAMLMASKDDPRRESLIMLCEELSRQTGYQATNHGTFDPQELAEHRATIKNRS